MEFDVWVAAPALLEQLLLLRSPPIFVWAGTRGGGVTTELEHTAMGDSLVAWLGCTVAYSKALTWQGVPKSCKSQ